MNILFYIAHPNTKYKGKYARKTIKKLLSWYHDSFNIYIITSKDLKYNKYLSSIENINVKYIELQNNNLIDFGKYYYAAKNLLNEPWGTINSVDTIEWVYFMNDSVILTGQIDKFFKNNRKDIDLLGILDSYEIEYHYQSYLFCINFSKINIFIEFIESYISLYGYEEKDKLFIIENLEIKLAAQFPKKDCIIKVKEGTGYIYNSNYSKYVSEGLNLIKMSRVHDRLNDKDKLPSFLRKMLKHK